MLKGNLPVRHSNSPYLLLSLQKRARVLNYRWGEPERQSCRNLTKYCKWCLSYKPVNTNNTTSDHKWKKTTWSEISIITWCQTEFKAPIEAHCQTSLNGISIFGCSRLQNIRCWVEIKGHYLHAIGLFVYLNHTHTHTPKYSPHLSHHIWTSLLHWMAW